MKTLLALFTFCLFISFNAQATQLRLNLKKGKEYRQVSNTKMTVINEMMGQKMKMQVISNSTLIYLVKKATDKDYLLEVRYDDMSMSLGDMEAMVAMGMDVKSMNKTFEEALTAMEDKSFEMTITRTGKVTAVKDIEELLKGVIDNLSDLPAAQKAQVETQIMQSYGGDAVKQNLEMLTAIYPEHSVKPGDNWTVDSKINFGMTMDISTKYELDKLTNKEVIISGKSLIDADLVNEEMKKMTGGMDIKSNMKGEIQSDYRIDRKTGWIVEANMTQQVTALTGIPESEQMPLSMEIKMVINSETKITN